LGQPNDIAVLVQSIKSVPEGRMPQPVIQEVACDHLVYFANPAGLKGLSDAVTQAFGMKDDGGSALQLIPTFAREGKGVESTF
jgi:hypothetical protein